MLLIDGWNRWFSSSGCWKNIIDDFKLGRIVKVVCIDKYHHLLLEWAIILLRHVQYLRFCLTG